MPVKLLDNEELLDVVEDGYILSGIKTFKRPVKESLQEIRRLYEVDDSVKV